MNTELTTHTVKYKTYFFVLVALIFMTLLSVTLTSIELGRLAVIGALLLAAMKSSLVLWFFMHLKYENNVLRLMIGLVLFVFLAVMIVTFLDYGFKK